MTGPGPSAGRGWGRGSLAAARCQPAKEVPLPARPVTGTGTPMGGTAPPPGLLPFHELGRAVAASAGAPLGALCGSRPTSRCGTKGATRPRRPSPEIPCPPPPLAQDPASPSCRSATLCSIILGTEVSVPGGREVGECEGSAGSRTFGPGPAGHSHCKQGPRAKDLPPLHSVPHQTNVPGRGGGGTERQGTGRHPSAGRPILGLRQKTPGKGRLPHGGEGFLLASGGSATK